MTAYPCCAGLARSPFVLTEHISSGSERDIITVGEIEPGSHVRAYVRYRCIHSFGNRKIDD